jgi:tetratricopeptide (TPR) repeat protein
MNFAKGDYDQAVTNYTQSITLEPEHRQDAYTKRGDIYFAKGEHDRAIADYTQVIRRDPNNSDAYINRGLAYRNKGEYDKAIADFSNAVSLNPSSGAYFYRGAAYYQKGESNRTVYAAPGDSYEDYDKSIVDFAQAINIKNQDLKRDSKTEAYTDYGFLPEAYTYRGLAYTAKGDYDGAIEDFTKVIRELYPPIYFYYNENKKEYNGNVYKTKKEYDLVKEYDRVNDENNRVTKEERDRVKKEHDRVITESSFISPGTLPHYSEVYTKRAMAYTAKENYDQAIDDLTRAIILNPTPEGFYYRGLAYYQKGEKNGTEYYRIASLKGEKPDYDLAIDDFIQAIARNPAYSEAYTDLGKTYLAIGKNEDAITAFENAIVLDDTNAVAYFNRGKAYYKINENDKAVEDFFTSIRLDPNSTVAYIHRGLTYIAKGDPFYDRAIEDFNQAMRIQEMNGEPRDEAYFYRGNAYYYQGKYDQAIEDFNRVSASNSSYVAAAYNMLGNAYADKRYYDRAISHFNLAIGIDPVTTNAYTNRGNAFRAKGDYDQAIADFSKAIELNAKDAIAYAYRGYAYYSKGQQNQAVRDLEKALSLNQNYEWARSQLKGIRGW